MPSFKHQSNIKIFSISVLVGSALVLSIAAYSKWKTAPEVPVKYLTRNISVTEQLKLTQVEPLSRQGFKTIIDLRPDSEALDQPASSEVEALAKVHKLAFAYVPVPHGDIPDDAVNKLAIALANSPKPILMYCRSGKRAARTWSLVEASRSGGLEEAAILAAVKSSGQSAEDLDSLIKTRIAKRAAGDTK